jgi:hypothetical protein
MHLTLIAIATLTILPSGVYTSEFDESPVAEGWELALEFCEPESWLSDGWYVQQLDGDACPDEPEGAQDTYRRSIEEYNDAKHWFLEFRVETSGNESEIPAAAPAVVAAANSAGVGYNATVSSGVVKFFRNVGLPILFIEVERNVPHTVRLELRNGETNTFRWFLDGVVIDEGEARGPFPAFDSRVGFRGKSWLLPNVTRWDYFRYGTIPDNDGDFDSNGTLDARDLFYFCECQLDPDNGPGREVGPSCAFADIDGDGDVDFHDFALFQLAYTVPD